MVAFPADGIAKSAIGGDGADAIPLARQLEQEGRFSEARECLRRAAQQGLTAAKAELALRLIAYPPYTVLEGIAWAKAAAQEGDSEAAHLMAVVTAEGLGVPQDWNAALDWLQRAAERGHRHAQTQLVAFAGTSDATGDLAHGPTTFARLRRAIDLRALLSTPKPRTLSATPAIAAVEGFMPPAVCDFLIERGRPHLQRAQIFDQKSGAYVAEDARTNKAAEMNFTRSDVMLAVVRARMAALTGLPIDGFEDSAVLHYDPGEEFSPHYDFFDRNVPGHLQELQGGQRVLTFLVYLNEGYEAGETAFPRIGLRHKGGKGDALLFWNAGRNGTPDFDTLHAGTPPASGEKWLLSQWVRLRPG